MSTPFNLEQERAEFDAANKEAKTLSDQLKIQVGYMQAEAEAIDNAVIQDMSTMLGQLDVVPKQTEEAPE